MVEYTSQLFIFDVVTQLIIVISIVIMYLKTRELYSLSMQRGIKYLNNAMLFYFIGFSARLITTLLDFSDGIYRTYEQTLPGLGLVTLNIYASLLGGFFLAYCLVWRLFEKNQFKSRSIWRLAVLYVFALVIVIADMYLMIFYKVKIPYLFYITTIGILLYAIISNTTRCCKLSEPSKDINPFLSLVGLGLGVYIATLIENLLYSFLFTIHYYAAGLYVVFTLAFLFNILKLSK